MEMYLKTIFEIAGDGGQPRVKLIAQRLGVTMPSVSGAIENLQKKGLVEHTPYGDVKLTTKGRRVARQVKDRNEIIYRFLLDVLKLLTSPAPRDACELEHVVSPKTLDRIGSFLKFADDNKDDAYRVFDLYAEWLKHNDSSGDQAEI
jgi:DtxR family Mn-dependent transcriptional regulator